MASLIEKLWPIVMWHGHPGDILSRRIRVRDENREKLIGELVAIGVPGLCFGRDWKTVFVCL